MPTEQPFEGVIGRIDLLGPADAVVDDDSLAL